MREDSLRELERTLVELDEQAASVLAAAGRAAGEAGTLAQQIGGLEAEVAQREEHRAACAESLDEARSQRDRHQQALQQVDAARASLTEQISQARPQLAEPEHRFALLSDTLRD